MFAGHDKGKLDDYVRVYTPRPCRNGRQLKIHTVQVKASCTENCPVLSLGTMEWRTKPNGVYEVWNCYWTDDGSVEMLISWKRVVVLATQKGRKLFTKIIHHRFRGHNRGLHWVRRIRNV